MVVPSEKTFAYKVNRISTSHFMIDWSAVSWITPRILSDANKRSGPRQEGNARVQAISDIHVTLHNLECRTNLRGLAHPEEMS